MDSKVLYKCKSGTIDLEIYDKLLGEGGQAVVYKGVANRADIAVKVIKKAFLTNSHIDDSIREISYMVKFNHPNIIKIFATVKLTINNNDYLGIIMEYYKDGSLYDVLSNTNIDLNKRSRVLFSAYLCEGIKYIHDMNIIHRDIKPGNILVLLSRIEISRSRIVLTDYGLATITNNNNNKTVVGTPSYIAPEVAMGNPYGKPADIYSTGITISQIMSIRYNDKDNTITSLIDDMININPDKRYRIDQVLKVLKTHNCYYF